MQRDIYIIRGQPYNSGQYFVWSTILKNYGELTTLVHRVMNYNTRKYGKAVILLTYNFTMSWTIIRTNMKAVVAM